MYEFPFSIIDIVHLLNLNIHRTNDNGWYVDCPFCSKKGKMNVNIEKNVFRCNYCGHSGGMLRLYGDIHNLSNGEAFKEIKNALGNFIMREAIYPHKTSKINQLEPVDYQHIHQVYTALSELLTLSDFHKKALLKRGLSEDAIIQQGYKSVPLSGYDTIVEMLLHQGLSVKNVPGFYTRDCGTWNIHFSKRCQGILAPFTHLNGQIQAYQIRLDVPFSDGTKYIWLSSAGKTNGISCGSPVHLVGNPCAKTIYGTEGSIKGNVAHYLSGHTYLCTAGVNSEKHLRKALTELKRYGAEIYVDAYDADKKKNPHVEHAVMKNLQIAKECGYQTRRKYWNARWKGIDDYYLAIVKTCV